MQSLMSSFSGLRPTRTWRVRIASVYQKSRKVLAGVRYPNALLAGTVLVPVIVGGFFYGQRTVEARESLSIAVSGVAADVGLGIESIRIDGLRDTREGDVLDYLAVTPDTSVLGFDIDAARDRVIALPWVKDASVRRVYPTTLLVDIEEHAPFARMLQNGRVHLVTLEGEEITDEIAGAHAALPLVVGEGAPAQASAFFSQLAARDHVLDNVVALERVGDRRWTLHMRDDVQVHLPEAGVDDALVRLENLMRRHAVLDRAVSVIDMRLGDRLVVRLTDAAVESLGELTDTSADARGGA